MKLKNVIAYILKMYPSKGDLSNARVTKMVYLADWHQAIHYHRQITHITWQFDHYGPFVQDVKNTVLDNPDLFDASVSNNYYGWSKSIFTLKTEGYIPSLTEQEKKSLDYIIEITKNLNWNDFIKLVYSTYPITSSNRYSSLDLIVKAREYIEKK